MKYYKDTNNRLYAFEDNATQDIIDNVAKKHNTNLTRITETQYKSFKLFGTFDKSEEEIKNKEKKVQFNNVQNSKILQLKQDFETLRNKTAHILSKTINKEINARQQDLVNIDSLISILPDDTTTIEFRCYDNSFVKVNKQQLLNIKKEIIQEGIDTYKRKWALEQKIKSATSIDELNSIKWDEKLNEVDNT